MHPPPGERESLTSWLDRLAVLYQMTSDQLIGPQNLPRSAPYPAYDLNVHPPPAVLSALSQRTGQSVDRLKAMTLSGWAPAGPAGAPETSSTPGASSSTTSGPTRFCSRSERPVSSARTAI
ncbi:hypothetical protein GCM10009789_40380 [Kribbella sancticallisti]|uniref:TniQ domain-containing protein n=1 Tax=Kribbella sancticallisti TaxID=460087 RepID=A0ABP4PIS0_9ACTN